VSATDRLRQAELATADARDELVAIGMYADASALGDDPGELRRALAHIAAEAREAVARLKADAS
jgi:hypothetical protein